MALRNIVVEGDPILRKRCREVEKVDDRIRMILDDMVETMREAPRRRTCGAADWNDAKNVRGRARRRGGLLSDKP